MNDRSGTASVVLIIGGLIGIGMVIVTALPRQDSPWLWRSR